MEYLPELSAIIDMSIAHVAPESRLKLIVTVTAPGLGDTAPDNVTDDPMDIDDGDSDKVILVDGLVNVVNVVDVPVLVDV